MTVEGFQNGLVSGEMGEFKVRASFVIMMIEKLIFIGGATASAAADVMRCENAPTERVDEVASDFSDATIGVDAGEQSLHFHNQGAGQWEVSTVDRIGTRDEHVDQLYAGIFLHGGDDS